MKCECATVLCIFGYLALIIAFVLTLCLCTAPIELFFFNCCYPNGLEKREQNESQQHKKTNDAKAKQFTRQNKMHELQFKQKFVAFYSGERLFFSFVSSSFVNTTFNCVSSLFPVFFSRPNKAFICFWTTRWGSTHYFKQTTKIAAPNKKTFFKLFFISFNIILQIVFMNQKDDIVRMTLKMEKICNVLFQHNWYRYVRICYRYWYIIGPNCHDFVKFAVKTILKHFSNRTKFFIISGFRLLIFELFILNFSNSPVLIVHWLLLTKNNCTLEMCAFQLCIRK